MLGALNAGSLSLRMLTRGLRGPFDQRSNEQKAPIRFGAARGRRPFALQSSDLSECILSDFGPQLTILTHCPMSASDPKLTTQGFGGQGGFGLTAWP